MSSATRYDQDFFAWANEQAGPLRAGRLAEADIAHIADEIESMGKSEKRELVSRLTVLLLHLLKGQFQAALRSHGRRNSVRVQRISLDSLIRDNPSLMSVHTNAVADAYRIARIEAEGETGIPEATFPSVCPWSFGQIMDDDFWPGGD